ncbi:phosphatidylinositol 4-phosphate 5-kinase 4-like isoform X1 [Vigna umbellata]|uniref:phosphatidylinositol 4-phosphate 5-kinase 4-like isoform X1 n=1 Tax=Vigna umbellata TaxID=87088 RepID=UPI001F5F343D|nr:phosphatidylinositol 4-phosphate 5-kinase 4-like isoform X1 [Vigna umbellata]
MHHKKSELQIGKESTGVSSDFNPLRHHPNHHHHPIPNLNLQTQTSTVPYKRPSLCKSPILNRFPKPCRATVPSAATTTWVSSVVSLRSRLRLLIFFSLPFFYFLVSHPTNSFILDFLAAFFFSAALFFSVSLALPRIPSIRFFLKPEARPALKLPVFWARPAQPEFQFCVVAYPNGDVYEGEFRGGKCCGSGVYYYSMSGRYEGDWVEGKYDGFGVETWARGSRYRGQYRQGLRHGFGVYRFYTGDVYAGEWASGQSHGCGVHTCEDGSRYVGEFKWGVKHGLGHYHFRNGDTYAGEYFADKMHGYGVYSFANGHCYEGSWHEGKRQGIGMYAFRNGETQSGHWQNGVIDTPSSQSATYPVSPVGVNHSRVLNAVQEARRAAKKAYDVAKVDERVNRAVTAANRAANAARVASVKAVQNQMHHNVNSKSIPIPIV